jgi:hypothetical protein
VHRVTNRPLWNVKFERKLGIKMMNSILLGLILMGTLSETTGICGKCWVENCPRVLSVKHLNSNHRISKLWLIEITLICVMQYLDLLSY